MSQLISIDQFEKILTGTLSSENFIIDKLECKALCEHNIIDGILTIKLQLLFNSPPLKKIKKKLKKNYVLFSIKKIQVLKINLIYYYQHLNIK